MKNVFSLYNILLFILSLLLWMEYSDFYDFCFKFSLLLIKGKLILIFFSDFVRIKSWLRLRGDGLSRCYLYVRCCPVLHKSPFFFFFFSRDTFRVQNSGLYIHVKSQIVLCALAFNNQARNSFNVRGNCYSLTWLRKEGAGCTFFFFFFYQIIW